tara:strand:- start:409 stop:621 length:213 start_codon:yes stop_codon:yes gene_type:complete
MDPAQLKKNFTEQIEKTDAQIRDLEDNLAKAKEYKTKLTGGLETLGLLEGEGEGESATEAPTITPEVAPS